VSIECSVADVADAASLQQQRARAGSISEGCVDTITEIDCALERLRAGSYGISDISDNPITFERLSAIPWARTSASD
jgi:RNA polymerase-binding transcription factor DksA